MNTGPNAVSDLIRRTTTRRLGTDPADAQLFQPSDGAYRRAPRGMFDWRPPPPEPVVYPPGQVPRLGRWRWKFVLFCVLAVAGGITASPTLSLEPEAALQPWTPPVVHLPQPPAPPVVTAPAPVPAVTPIPDVPESAPAAAAVPEPVPAEPPKAIKVKKRAHVTQRVVKPAAKHPAAAASTPAADPAPAPAPTKPVERTRPAVQANDSENPL